MASAAQTAASTVSPIANQPPPLRAFSYPFAAAPDIIRAHQKDAYFQGVLLNQLSDILRSRYGARFAHAHTAVARTASDMIYLGLTTLLGNRTLGEEYCDIVQIEETTSKLPVLWRRAAYIVTSVLIPFGLHKILPSLRARLRTRLEASLSKLADHKQQYSLSFKIQSYMLEHLQTITSPSPLQALTIMIFYFSGAYYQLSKRILGLRYVFTKTIPASEARVGYEVLGVLLALQVIVQGWLHARSTWDSVQTSELANASSVHGGMASIDGGVEVSLDPATYTANNELLFAGRAPLEPIGIAFAAKMHTPTADAGVHRYNLSGETTMRWIEGEQQRKCTLCLEGMRDPAATPCGHVFCWSCICDWVREKAECPLCRREAPMAQLLPLR